MLFPALIAAVAGACAGPSCRHPGTEAAQHHRLKTERGAVHVFRPSGYDPSTAGTVLYVHGYYTTLARACRRHDLRGQFKKSQVNALFIAVEAPAAHTQAVAWPDLNELLEAVEASGETLPPGPVVAVAHSGGFRTVAEWLPSERLDSVILLDALYGHEEDFGAWLDEAGAQHRLFLVGFNTTRRIERFVAGYPDEVERDHIPLRARAGELKQARLVFLRSQFGHMELVTRRRALPAVLRLTRLARIHPRIELAQRASPSAAKK